MIALLPWLPYNVHCNRNNSTTTALLLFTLHYQLWLFSQRLDDLLTRELSLVPLVSSLHEKRHCWKCKVNKHKAVVCWLFYIISLIFLNYHNYLAIKNWWTGSSSSLSTELTLWLLYYRDYQQGPMIFLHFCHLHFSITMITFQSLIHEKGPL